MAEYERVWWSPHPLVPGTPRPRRPRKVKDYYHNGRLRPYPGIVSDEYYFGPLWEYHRKAARLAMRLQDDDYKIPPGVAYAMKLQLTWNQIVTPYPWAIYLINRRGKRIRIRQRTITQAIMLHKRLIKKYSTATIVSLGRSYDIPPKYRGRLPGPWKWCPRCMKPRKFKRVYQDNGEPRIFYTMVKTWNQTKQRWVDKERKLAVMRCPMCHITNQDHVFRRSNQPQHVRKIRQGARRVKTPNPQRRRQVDESLYLMSPGRRRRRKK